MQIENIAVKDIKPFERNAKKHDETQISNVMESIKQFGFAQPITVDKNNVVIIGHCRLIAAKRLKMETVPVFRMENLTQEQVDKLRLLDNKLNESEWDFDLLSEDVPLLDFSDFDIDWGIEDKSDDNTIEIVEDEIPEHVETRCKLNDVWKLGNHKLICGDSTDPAVIDRLMDGKKGKLLFTSPPYNMNAKMYENYADNMKSREYIDFNLEVFNKWKDYTDYIMWNISYNKNARWEFIEIIYKLIKETGFRFLELIVWDKGHGMPIVSKDMLTRQYEDILVVGEDDAINRDMELYYVGTKQKRAYFNKKRGKGITNYWRIGTNNTQLKNHFACFPVALPAEAIKLMTDKTEIVLDCFGGSGSTLIACEQLNRKCYMVELDPKYCDVIIQRWENFTGQKAVKL